MYNQEVIVGMAFLIALLLLLVCGLSSELRKHKREAKKASDRMLTGLTEILDKVAKR